MHIFLTILSMSFTASFIISTVLIVRLILCRAPKIYSYVLWAAVLYRLLCPFTPQNPLSVVPQLSLNSAVYETESIYSGENYHLINYILNDEMGVKGINVENNRDEVSGVTYSSSDCQEKALYVLMYVWIAGMLVMVSYSTVQFMLLKRKLVGSVLVENNVFLSDYIQSPFVIGVIRPKIYLPSFIDSSETEYIVRHERCHIRRCDHITKFLAYMALCIHWFNPLVWLSFSYINKDMEMSCDEAVIKSVNEDIRSEYSTSILRFSAARNHLSIYPLAFAEGDTLERIKNVMKYKKPAVWLVIMAIAICMLTVVALITKPSENDENGNIIHDFRNIDVYVFYESVESIMKPRIILSKTDNSFQFHFSLFSSYVPIGTYELTDDTLTLVDGERKFVFEAEGDTFVFNQEVSHPIPKYRYSGASYETYSPVPDGAVFRNEKIIDSSVE